MPPKSKSLSKSSVKSAKSNSFKNNIKSVINRNGVVVRFDASRIENVILKALLVSKEGGRKEAKDITKRVTFILNKRFRNGELPTVENIQDIIEECLVSSGFRETAKRYILYREQRRKLRETLVTTDESIKLVGSYLDSLD